VDREGALFFLGWSRVESSRLISRNENADPILQRLAFSKRNAYLSVRISQENRMHWKKRQKQIQYLQAKHGNDRSLARQFPDLRVEQRAAPCSNGMRGSTARRVLPPGMKQFPIGHCHKQGYELIIPGTDLQWMGGKKP
jgi:hypothetical protein